MINEPREVCFQLGYQQVCSCSDNFLTESAINGCYGFDCDAHVLDLGKASLKEIVKDGIIIIKKTTTEEERTMKGKERDRGQQPDINYMDSINYGGPARPSMKDKRYEKQ